MFRRVRLVLAIVAVMVAMLAAGQSPAMAQVVVGDGSCDNGFFGNNFSCDGFSQDGVSQGLSTNSNSGTVTTSLTVSHTA